MDLNFTPEEEEFRLKVRRFLEENVPKSGLASRRAALGRERRQPRASGAQTCYLIVRPAPPRPAAPAQHALSHTPLAMPSGGPTVRPVRERPGDRGNHKREAPLLHPTPIT